MHEVEEEEEQQINRDHEVRTNYVLRMYIYMVVIELRIYRALIRNTKVNNTYRSERIQFSQPSIQ